MDQTQNMSHGDLHDQIIVEERSLQSSTPANQSNLNGRITSTPLRSIHVEGHSIYSNPYATHQQNTLNQPTLHHLHLPSTPGLPKSTPLSHQSYAQLDPIFMPHQSTSSTAGNAPPVVTVNTAGLQNHGFQNNPSMAVRPVPNAKRKVIGLGELGRGTHAAGRNYGGSKQVTGGSTVSGQVTAASRIDHSALQVAGEAFQQVRRMRSHGERQGVESSERNRAKAVREAKLLHDKVDGSSQTQGPDDIPQAFDTYQ